MAFNEGLNSKIPFKYTNLAKIHTLCILREQFIALSNFVGATPRCPPLLCLVGDRLVRLVCPSSPAPPSTRHRAYLLPLLLLVRTFASSPAHRSPHWPATAPRAAVRALLSAAAAALSPELSSAAATLCRRTSLHLARSLSLFGLLAGSPLHCEPPSAPSAPCCLLSRLLARRSSHRPPPPCAAGPLFTSRDLSLFP
ncbi:hypothetical protein Scep_024517 [Stephania cephalantha]|uniref:Uncharacterized protein n=1 Tax=Stephania cephalantha TaxID=152367 RepID=A0AAP0F276_9MAGN